MNKPTKKDCCMSNRLSSQPPIGLRRAACTRTHLLWNDDVITPHVYSSSPFLMWQNYSTTYWSGMYTTLFWVGFSGFKFMQIFFEKTLCLWNFFFFRKRGEKDRIRKALTSCGCARDGETKYSWSTAPLRIKVWQ